MAAQRAGPFISATTCRLWRFGQRLTASDLAPEPPPAAKPSGIQRINVSLADLLRAGILQPGRGAIGMTYKGHAFSADLAADGAIESDGQRFPSPTAFTLHCKRQISPTVSSDDGWRNATYGGRPLEHYRAQYQQVKGGGGASAPAPDKPPKTKKEPPAAAAAAAAQRPQRPQRAGRGKRRRGSVESDSDYAGDEDAYLARLGYVSPQQQQQQEQQQQRQQQQASPLMVGGQLVVELPPDAEVEGADRWVQCDRCQVWRIVPAEHWQAVQDDPRDEWRCEFADWDVSTMPPHKPPCSSD